MPTTPQYNPNTGQYDLPDGSSVATHEEASAWYDRPSDPILPEYGAGGQGDPGDMTPEQIAAKDKLIQDALANQPEYKALVRNPGESDADFKSRIANQSFSLAGGSSASVSRSGGGGSSAISAPVAPIMRSVYGSAGGSQNTLGESGYTSSGGIGEGGLADEQKKREEYLKLGSRGTERGVWETNPKTGIVEFTPYGQTPTSSLTEEQKRQSIIDAQSETAPRTQEEIQADLTKKAADQITAYNDLKNSLLSDQAEVNALRTRETNAQSVMSGLMGSSEAGGRAINTATKNAASNKEILTAAASDLSKLYMDIQDRAYTMAKDEKDTYLTASKDYLAKEEENKKKIITDITNLSKSGFDFNAIKNSDPQTYNQFVKAAGGVNNLNAVVTLNRPQEAIIDKRVENGKYIIAYQNPLTGKTRIETVDVGVPSGYNKSVDLGDKIMFIQDNFNPDTDKPLYINKGIDTTKALQQESLRLDIQKKAKDLTSPPKEALTPYQQFTATQSIAKDTQARTETAREMARQAELIQSSYNNIIKGGDRSLNTQAIITSFNKILDPTSVVRESEYDRTAAGQALIARLQGKYDNIISGGAGVTEATLKEAADIAKKYLDGARASISTQNKRARDMANEFGLNPDFVTGTYQDNSTNGQKTEEQQMLDLGYTQEQIDQLKNQ